MTRARNAVERLSEGSHHLTRRLGARASAWVAKGRREDLEGWRASLGCWFRLALLAGAAYMAARTLRAAPALLWPLAALWNVAAWRTGTPAKAHPEAAEGAPAEVEREALLTLLRTLIGDRPGVHLSTLAEQLPPGPDGTPRQVSELRDQLAALGVPVRRSVKVAGRVANGVHRDDLPAPAPAEAAVLTT